MLDACAVHSRSVGAAKSNEASSPLNERVSATTEAVDRAVSVTLAAARALNTARVSIEL